MDNLGVIVGFLALIGGPLGAWVLINKAITKLIAENVAMEKQFTSLEITTGKEIKRLEDDYRDRFEDIKKDQREHEEKVDKNFVVLYSKMDDNTKDILSRIDGVTKEITDLKIKLAEQ